MTTVSCRCMKQTERENIQRTYQVYGTVAQCQGGRTKINGSTNYNSRLFNIYEKPASVQCCIIAHIKPQKSTSISDEHVISNHKDTLSEFV